MSLIGLFIISFIGIYLNVWFLLLFLENRNLSPKIKKVKSFPSVSILIPAHNEEKNISKTINSVLNLDYPKKKLEVIVIDNASTDKTSEKVKKFKRVKLIRIPEKGKAIALNEGLKRAKGEIIGILDADSTVTKSCLKEMIKYFGDEKVGGVTNFIKVNEKKNLISKLQHIEYLLSALSKKLVSDFDTYFILPGTLSLVRADLVKKIGFSSSTLTEDLDLGLEVVKRGYKIVNCIKPVSYTKIPNKLKTWFKQRIRWYRGFIQNTIKHKDLIFTKRFSTLGWFLIIIAGYFAITIGIYVTLLNFYSFFHNFFVMLRSANFLPLTDQINLAIANFPSSLFFFSHPYAWVISLIIFSSSFAIFLLTLKVFRSFNLKTVLLLPIYMLIYYSLVMLVWFLSIILEAVRWKKEW